MAETKTAKKLTGGIIAIIVLAVCLCITTFALVYASVSVENNYNGAIQYITPCFFVEWCTLFKRYKQPPQRHPAGCLRRYGLHKSYGTCHRTCNCG